jgi:hypothetical protein
MSRAKKAGDACLSATLKAICEPDDARAKELADRSGELFVDYIRARMAARARGEDPDADEAGTGVLH